MVSSHSGIIRCVAFQRGRVSIENSDQMKSLRAQIRYHYLRIRKPIRIPGERFVTVHVMDVEPEAVGGDLLLAEGVSQQPHAGLGIITPPTLVIAERPKRRQRHPA